MTVISPTDFRDTTFGEAGFGWAASLEGDTTAPTEAFAGSHHRYAFPRLATLTLPAVIGPLDIQAEAAESVVSIQPRDLPAEYVPTTSSPQVGDPTAPGWSLPLQSADTPKGFRLTGIDQQGETEVQRKLFLASAAAGTAGGGLIWLVAAIGSVLNGVVQTRRNRRAPIAERVGELTPSLGSRTDVPDPPDYLRLIAAPALLALAGSRLAGGTANAGVSFKLTGSYGSVDCPCFRWLGVLGRCEAAHLFSYSMGVSFPRRRCRFRRAVLGGNLFSLVSGSC